MATLQRFDFPAGYPATERTVQLMSRVVLERYLHPRIRARVRQLFAGLPSLDTAAEIRAIWDHCLAHVRYQRDPVGAEYITDPVTLDEQIDEGLAGEDCESMALYAATLLAAAGYVSRWEIQGRDPKRPQRYTHCSLRVQDPRRKVWVSFDLVGALEFPGSFDLGDTVARPGDPIEWWDLEGKKVTSMDPSQFFEASDDSADLLGCTLGDATADKIVGGITGGLKTIGPMLGPYGAIASGVGTLVQAGYDLSKPQGAAPVPAPAPAPRPVASPAQQAANRLTRLARVPAAALNAAGGVTVAPPPSLGTRAGAPSSPAAAAPSSSSAGKVLAGGLGVALLAKLFL